jgi:hypothetical protein
VHEDPGGPSSRADNFLPGCLHHARAVLDRLDEVPLGTPFTILTTVNGTITGTFDEIVSNDIYTVTYLPQSVVGVLDEIVIFRDGLEAGDS